jgi:hypothetical protein
MNWAKVYWPRAIRENPNWFLYLPVPEGIEFDYASVGLEHERILKIPMKFRFLKQIDEMTEIQEEYFKLFSDFGGKYYLDAVVCDKPEILLPLKNYFSSPYRTSCVPPVMVANVQYALGADTHKKFMDSLFMAQSAGIAQADVISFVNENSQARAMKYARQHLAPTYVKHIMDNSYHYLNGVNIERVEGFRLAEKPKEPLTVSYGYGLNRVYQFEELFEIFDKLFCSGRNVKVLINSNSASAFNFDFSKYEKHFQVSLDCPQDEFYKMIAPAHAFLFMAKEFEMSYSACEKHLLGLIGVYLDSPRVRNIVYKGYPYIGKTKLELATILRFVLENYYTDEVQEVQRKQVEFIKAKYHGINNGRQYDMRIREAVQRREEYYAQTFDGKKLLLHEIFKNEKDLTYAQFKEKIEKGTTNGIDIEHNYGRYALSRTVWRHCMEQIGFMDTCLTADPHFVRIKDVDASVWSSRYMDMTPEQASDKEESSNESVE